MAPKTGTLRVRMYRVGFGDCFLVSLPVGDGHRHLLVDFGVHPKGDLGVLEVVIQNVQAETDGNLAVLVATHEHADHISGFGKFADALSRFRIGEIWMPWAMNPEDPVAQSMRKKRLTLVQLLDAHVRATLKRGGAAAVSQRAQDALLNLTGNALAMSNLHSRFGGAAQTIRYPRTGEHQTEPAGLTGASVRFLGPPTDEAFLRSMDPPPPQRYLKVEGGKPSEQGGIPLFGDKWRLSPAEGRKLLGLGLAAEKAFTTSSSLDLEALAFTLDSAMNNSSLVFLLTFRGQGLLFPGDAQWGNWKSWIETNEGASLLANVSFLKVAHHGSLNATPKDALERIPTGAFSAMVSTQTKPWDSIPRLPLMARLAEKTSNRFVRSDSLGTAAPRGPKLSSAPKGFRLDDLWADWTVTW